MSDQQTGDPAYVREARYLGHDAALASASWIVGMSESDARSILEDVDPEVMDRYPSPDLSGQWADDPTPRSLAHDVGANDGDIAFWGPELVDQIADAWCEGVDSAWSYALEAHALRVLGRTTDALRVEGELEAEAARLRSLRA
jgi:hypothetical protein